MPRKCSNVPTLTHKVGTLNHARQCKNCTCVLRPGFSSEFTQRWHAALWSTCIDPALYRCCRHALTLSPWNIYDFYSTTRNTFSECSMARQQIVGWDCNGTESVFGPNGFPVWHVTGKLGVMAKDHVSPHITNKEKEKTKPSHVRLVLWANASSSCDYLDSVFM